MSVNGRYTVRSALLYYAEWRRSLSFISKIDTGLCIVAIGRAGNLLQSNHILRNEVFLDSLYRSNSRRCSESCGADRHCICGVSGN